MRIDRVGCGRAAAGRGVVLRAALAVACALPVALSAGAARAVNCTVTPTMVAFGNYDPSSPVASTSTGNITVSCTGLVLSVTPFVLSLSSGSSGSMAMRAMTGGGSARLQYQLYADLAHATVLGDGSGGSTTISATIINLAGALLGSGNLTTTIYGQIPAGQMATPGSYTDTILATISF